VLLLYFLSVASPCSKKVHMSTQVTVVEKNFNSVVVKAY